MTSLGGLAFRCSFFKYAASAVISAEDYVDSFSEKIGAFYFNGVALCR